MLSFVVNKDAYIYLNRYKAKVKVK